MAGAEILTLHSISKLLVSPSSLYLVAYAWLFGMCEFRENPVEMESATNLIAVQLSG
jgi:hypothetical protein